MNNETSLIIPDVMSFKFRTTGHLHDTDADQLTTRRRLSRDQQMFYFRRSASLVGRVAWHVSKHPCLRHAAVRSNTHKRRWTQTIVNSNHVDGVLLSPKSMRCIRGYFPLTGGRSIRFTQWLK